MKREISKTPLPPCDLHEDLQELLTELCFAEESIAEPVELLFVYGTPFFITEISTHISDLLNKNIAQQVMLTGGIMPHGETHITQKSEARLIYERLLSFTKIKFILEEQSMNTLENVTCALELFNFSDYKKISFIFLAHCMRRGYLTLRKFLSHVKIIPLTYNAWYSGEKNLISRDTWHTFEAGVSRVWGEYLRIKLYGSRGDIAYDDETKELILKIEAASQT